MGLQRLSVPVKEFAQYVREHFFLSFAVAAAIALVYGKQAFSTDFYIDAEVVLNHPHTVYNWDQIGRFGLIALKLLVGNNWYNPYLGAVLFLLSLWAAGMSAAYLFSLLEPGISAGMGFIFTALFLVFPTHAEQFMFRFQAFEVAFSIFLTVMATRWFYLYFMEKNYWAYGLALVFDIFSFGVYQSMANLQVCFHIAVYLFLIAKHERTERVRLVKNETVHFLTAFALYELIAQLFFDSGNYLGGQMGWLSGSFVSAVMNLLAYIRRVLFAMDVFYPATYLGCVCCGAVFLAVVMARDRQKLWPYMIGIGGLLASPFFLALAMGTPLAYRAQCMLPFVCAVLWMFFALWLREGGAVRYALCILCGCGFLLCQASVVMRLFYTQDVIRDADREISSQIMARLISHGAQDGDKPVVFAGRLEARTNGSCYTKMEAGSYLSYSVYEFAYIVGVPVDTPDYFNTGRILGYYETLGFHYAMPSVELAEAAGAASSGMEAWPAEGSVLETADCIIVKLSKD